VGSVFHDMHLKAPAHLAFVKANSCRTVHGHQDPAASRIDTNLARWAWYDRRAFVLLPVRLHPASLTPRLLTHCYVRLDPHLCITWVCSGKRPHFSLLNVRLRSSTMSPCPLLRRPILDYSKLPPSPPVDIVFLLDPLIATGGTACAALTMIVDWGIPGEYG
jgi:hypothetical protein